MLLFALLLLASVVVWLSVHPEARETAKKRWQEAREGWTQDTGPHEPEKQPKAPEASPASEPGNAGWLPGRYSHSATYAGAPFVAGYPNSVTVLTNTAYVVGYDETTRNPAWAAYRLSSRRLGESFPRPGRFEIDPRSLGRVSHDDYTRSGFDRGHMVPQPRHRVPFWRRGSAGDVPDDERRPSGARAQPGPLAVDGGGHCGSCGSGLRGGVGSGRTNLSRPPPTALPSGVRIPDAFYCVVVDELPTGPRMQAFVMRQDTPRQANFRDFLTTVDDVEQSSGWDFFRELPDQLENAAEAQSPRYWLE